MRNLVIALLLSVAASCISADGTSEDDFTMRVVMKLYHDCAKDVGLSVCFKKRAITLVDSLERMENVSLIDGVTLHRVAGMRKEPAVTDLQLDHMLPRSLEEKEDTLSKMLMDKVFDFVGARSLEISMPRFTTEDFVREGRSGDFDFGGGGGGGKRKGGGGGGGGGGKKGGKKGGGMMIGLMGIIAAKMAALMALMTGLTFIIAKKALIVGKIAFILSMVMLFKKLMRNGGGSGGSQTHEVVHSSGGGGWDSGGHGSSGWQSGGSGGGGWGRTSLDAQNLAYGAYNR